MELNQRLAPDVDIGVLDVTKQDCSPVDHLVIMGRMPAGRQLSRLVRSSSRHVIPCLAGVARQLTEFHEAASRSPEIDRAATQDAIARVSLDNFETMQQYRDVVLNGSVLDECRYLAEAFVAGRAPLFDKRLKQGCICDGHGDLQADDIFYLDDGPRILDCLEFDDTLCYGDVANDVAFLAMDLERLSDPASARAFIRLYEQASGTQIPPALLHFYIAYRAAVRAKASVYSAPMSCAMSYSRGLGPTTPMRTTDSSKGDTPRWQPPPCTKSFWNGPDPRWNKVSPSSSTHPGATTVLVHERLRLPVSATPCWLSCAARPLHPSPPPGSRPGWLQAILNPKPPLRSPR
ncbi:MAG: hypothetical protein N2037_11780 [Acidimicrobiales bacterium]|nr:hypothetical protein [Acidimicrobiales bacterium]